MLLKWIALAFVAGLVAIGLVGTLRALHLPLWGVYLLAPIFGWYGLASHGLPIVVTPDMINALVNMAKPK